MCGFLGSSLPLAGKPSSPSFHSYLHPHLLLKQQQQHAKCYGHILSCRTLFTMLALFSAKDCIQPSRSPKRYSRNSIRRTRSLLKLRTALPRRSMVPLQRMRPDVLLQRPSERESLKLASGVSWGEPVAGAQRGRRDGARALQALGRTWCLLRHPADQRWLSWNPVRCRGMSRTARELSRAASAERNGLCCRNDCDLDCAEGQ